MIWIFLWGITLTDFITRSEQRESNNWRAAIHDSNFGYMLRCEFSPFLFPIIQRGHGDFGVFRVILCLSQNIRLWHVLMLISNCDY
jgi:hypothetical protein